MLKVTALWEGFSGAPGYSNLYFGTGIDAVIHTTAEAAACANRLTAFFNAIKAYMPQTVKVTVQPIVQVLNAATGDLVDELSVAPPPALVQGTDVGAFSAPTGVCLSWRTTTIVNGKRLRGKTFLVPMGASMFATDGTPANAATTAIVAAAQPMIGNTLATGEALAVWHRPVNGAGGSVGKVVQATVTDKAAVLRSRRD